LRVPIITYHAIGDKGAPLWTPVDVFQAHIRGLAENGWKTMTLGDLISNIRKGKNIKEKTCVLTFDDGYESVYTEAWPRLKRYGFTGTVFLITNYCGKTNQWAGQPETVPVENLLNWNQVIELSKHGIEFGSHTTAHASLTVLTPDKVVEELANSRDAVERHTGKPSRVFAFPYGDYNSSIIKFVRRYFDGAVGTSLGLVDDTSSLYLLPRIDAYYLNPRWIPQLQRNRFKEYLRLRQAMRSIRRLVYPDYQPPVASAPESSESDAPPTIYSHETPSAEATKNPPASAVVADSK
jgi:peptidoglycan/xylan/chitin deacetylase (PgdA/CDA1 family)